MPVPSAETEMLVSTWKDGQQIYGFGTVSIGSTVAYVKAYFDKTSLSAGDTVNITVKKVDANGIESNFLPETNFEAGIMEGCTVGNILTQSGVTGQYFSAAKMPIRFIVNTTLTEADTAVVLRIGVPAGSDTTFLPFEMLSRNNILQTNINNRLLKISKKDKTQLKQKMEAGCSTSSFEYSGYGLAGAKLGADCSKMTEHICTDGKAENVSEFVIQCFQNGQDGEDVYNRVKPIDAGKLGCFYPLEKRFGFDDLFACYNKDKNLWFYKTPDNNIKIRVIKEFNTQRMVPEKYRIIDSKDALKTIKPREVKAALLDFENQFKYSNGILDEWPHDDKKFFLITEWIYKHENIHQKDYEQEIIKITEPKFRKRLINMWKPNCNKFKNNFKSNYESLLEQGKSQISGILYGKTKNDPEAYITILKNYYNDLINTTVWSYTKKKYLSREEYTQSRVEYIINDYINSLRNLNKTK